MSSGKTIVDIATDVAVITFNDGFSGLFAVYDALGLTVGPHMHEFCEETDANRVKTAERRMSDFAKEARRSITSGKKKRRRENEGPGGTTIWCRDSRLKVKKLLWTIFLRFLKFIDIWNFKRVFLETMFSKTASSRTQKVYIQLTSNLNSSFIVWLSSEVHTILAIN